MRPSLVSWTSLEPDFLPPDAKLEAGYVRYVRALRISGPNEELYFETCIRRSQYDEGQKRHLDGFSYSAISYAWDDPTPTRKLIVDGEERMVAENLWHFLHLEYSEYDYGLDGWLWIDALCIDQSDARERTHQVGIMSEIFGRTDNVISWLGPAYDNSDHAMHAIAISHYSNPFTGRRTSKYPVLTQADMAQAICSLCERSYWKRLWVFQELRHARRIELMCETTRISWHEFTQLWRTIVDIAATDEKCSDRLKQSLATRMMTLRAKPIDFSLWNLLKETRNLECADQRDRVYALLSVATVGREGIEANYHNGVTPLHLAHSALQNKYSMRPPGALDDVLMDCEFLEDVFRMNRGDMLRYRRHDAGGHVDFAFFQTVWYSRHPESILPREFRRFGERVKDEHAEAFSCETWVQYDNYCNILPYTNILPTQ
ncbi:hypothetical protein Q7P36_006432 [Cladosporium allicinum]